MSYHINLMPSNRRNKGNRVAKMLFNYKLNFRSNKKIFVHAPIFIKFKTLYTYNMYLYIT